MDAEQLADYLERAGKFGLDSLDDVAAAAALHGTIWLDVRSGGLICTLVTTGCYLRSVFVHW